MAREVPLHDLLAGLDGVRITAGDTAGVAVRGITEDSRLVKKDWLFIARKGERFDGRLFIAQAFQHGAAAVMIENDAGTPEATHDEGVRIVMDNAAETIGKVAQRFFHHPTKSLTLIGITGTNGKTTTAHLIHELLNQAGKKCGLIGTVNIDDGRGMKPATLTTPFAIDLNRTLATMVANNCTHAVMEVSSHALMQNRVSGLHFTGGIFTNLTGDHLDYHGTMDNYADAKSLLFKSLNQETDPWAVINIDDQAGERMARACGSNVTIMNTHQGIPNTSPDWSVSINNITTNGMGLSIRCGNNEQSLHTQLLGKHNAMNLLQACAAVVQCGVPLADVCRIAKLCKAPPGRLEPVTTRNDTTELTVLIDYAHTDDALANVLKAVRPIADASEGRVLVVFGCGGDRDKSKRPRMMKTARSGADVLMVTSDNPRTENPDAIVNDILVGVNEIDRTQMVEAGKLFIETDRRRAIEITIEKIAQKGDIVLIAGKGHEDYQIIGNTKHAFDDRVIARHALLRRLLQLKQGSATQTSKNISNIFWSPIGFAIATGGKLVRVPGCEEQDTSPSNNKAISGISINSRTLQNGEAFLAIAGERFDGHDYIEKAFAQGARLAVVDHAWWENHNNNITMNRDATQGKAPEDHTFLVVEDTVAALARLASVWREVLRNNKTKVIGITGSCGKTTTKEILHKVLSERYQGSAAIKSYNNEIGVPLTILSAEPDHEYLIVEIGSNAPGEIHTLGSIARPDIAIITNVGRSHLAGFGSVPGVAREKVSLLSTLASQNSWAVCPADSAELQSIAPEEIRTVWFGESRGSDLRLIDETLINNENKITTQFTLADNSHWYLPVIGKHFVLDALAVIATARALAINDTDIQSGLSKLRLPDMRMEEVKLPNGIRIFNDAYNANPESMLASLYAFLQMTPLVAVHHRILILGEMLELGNETIPCHREIMLKVARLAQRHLIGRAVFIGNAFREASKSGIRFGCARSNGPVLDWVDNIEDHGEMTRVVHALKPGDAVLLKGSRRLGLERIITNYQQHIINETTRPVNKQKPSARKEMI